MCAVPGPGRDSMLERRPPSAGSASRFADRDAVVRRRRVAARDRHAVRRRLVDRLRRQRRRRGSGATRSASSASSGGRPAACSRAGTRGPSGTDPPGRRRCRRPGEPRAVVDVPQRRRARGRRVVLVVRRDVEPGAGSIVFVAALPSAGRRRADRRREVGQRDLHLEVVAAGRAVAVVDGRLVAADPGRGRDDLDAGAFGASSTVAASGPVE